MEPGMGTVQVAGGHGRWNLEFGQLVASGHGRWNLEWGQRRLQAAMGDGIWNGDSSGCRRPVVMEPGVATTQVAGCHGRWDLEWGHLWLQAAMGD